MAGTLPPVVGLLRLDASQFMLSLGEVRSQLAAMATETGAAGTAVADSAGLEVDSAEAAATKVGAAHEEIGASAAGMATGAEKAEQDIEASHGRIESESSGFSSRVASIFNKVGSTMGNWGLPFGEAVSGMGEKIDDAESKGSGFRSSLESIGKVATLGAAVGIAAVAGESVNLANKQASAATSLAASAGISVQAATAIGNAFVDTGFKTIYTGTEMTTAYAAVAAQLATVQGHALSTADATKVMAAAADLAEGSGTSLASATSTLGSVMRAYGVSAAAAGQTSDDLFQAARQTGVGLSQVGTSLQRLHTQLGASTPSLAQTSGLLVDMTEHGETGKSALTALSTAFAGIIKPTTAVTAAQKAMNVSFINAKTGAMDPLSQIIGELQPKIAGMGGAQATATLQSLGFGTAASKLVQVVQAGPAAFNTAAASVSKLGAAHDAAAKQSQTMSHQLETLKAGLEDEGVKIGQALIPKIQDLIKVVSSVVNWFMQHKAAAIAVAVVVGGALVVAVAAYTLSMLAAAAATIVAMAPILAIVAVVALVGAAIYELVTHWNVVWAAIKAGAEDIWKFLDGIWHSIIGGVTTAWDWIENFFRKWWPVIVGVMSGGLLLIPALFIKFHDQIINTITNLVNTVVGFFTKLPGEILDALKGAGQWLVNIGSDIIIGLWNGIMGWWGTLANWLASIPNLIWSFFQGAGTWLLGIGKSIIDGLINGIKSGFNDVKNVLGGLTSDIVSWKGPPSTDAVLLTKNGQLIMGGLITGIQSKNGDLRSALGGVSSLIAGSVTGSAVAGSVGAASVSAATTAAANAAAGGPGAGQAGGDIVLQIDGTAFARVTGPFIRTNLLQKSRQVVAVGLK